MFRFNSKQYEYFKHPYNNAAENMRTLEVPIIHEYLRHQSAFDYILEIGNVLSHYGKTTWDIIDLKEGPIKQDLMTWEPQTQYDLIVSISTVEHINASPEDIIQKIRSLLTLGGKAIITLPTGYNPEWDKSLLGGELNVIVVGCMERRDDNSWIECSLWDAVKKPYRQGSYTWSEAMVVLKCD